jgi:glucose-6-phosphate isomerase
MSFNIGHFHNLNTMSSSSLWQRFQQHFLYYRDLGFSLDISRMKFPDDFFEKMQPKIDKAFAAMRALETGAIGNPTEKRMVGHYWLRNCTLAPTPEIRAEIEETIKRIKTFAADIHGGKWKTVSTRVAHWHRRFGARAAIRLRCARITE